MAAHGARPSRCPGVLNLELQPAVGTFVSSFLFLRPP